MPCQFSLFSELRYLPRLSQSFQIQPMPHLNQDSDQTYKGIDVDIINEVAKRKNWDVNQTFPGFDAAVNAVQSGQADALWPVLLLPTHVRRSLLSQTLITTPQLLSTHVVAIKSATTKQLKGKNSRC